MRSDAQPASPSSPPPTRLGIVIVLLWMTHGALAQEPVDLRQDQRTEESRPVDEGVGDVSVLGTSLRVVDPGLDAALGFDDVYRVPGMPMMLMRVSGGIYAVFPQSVYSAEGALVPPGTIFYIGPPGAGLAPPPPRRTNPPESMEPPPLSPEVQELLTRGWTTAHGATIANDAIYRKERLQELMQRAAESEMGDEAIDENGADV